MTHKYECFGTDQEDSHHETHPTKKETFNVSSATELNLNLN